MPLSINVGLSRKASKDYQSTGVSINVTAELDQALLARPEQLQSEMANLYAQARAALDRQTGDGAPAPAPALQNGRGQNTRPTDNGQPPPPMTASQRRAIETICRRRGLDPIAESRQQIGAEFDRLTLREASHLIDALKGVETAARNGGGP